MQAIVAGAFFLPHTLTFTLELLRGGLSRILRFMSHIGEVGGEIWLIKACWHWGGVFAWGRPAGVI
jgi:hypothetical protein